MHAVRVQVRSRPRDRTRRATNPTRRSGLKLHDIANLKAILQLPAMPRPIDTLFDVSLPRLVSDLVLLGKLLVSFSATLADDARAVGLAQLFVDTIRAAPDVWKTALTPQRLWRSLTLRCRRTARWRW